MVCNMQVALLAALVSVIVAAPQYSPQPAYQYSTPIPIVSQKQDVSPDGSYYYSFQSGNGIAVEEKSAYRALGPEEGTQSVQGYFLYPGPDGVQYSVAYTADENGFIAQGAHLPTSPPLPEEIAKVYATTPRDDNQYDERGFPIGPAGRPFRR